ncbi:hypothetical protein HAX54_024810 [Datura stramonium]|uniref:65-kDa microtubule-associated protein 6 n=1 Tax=Datura stramonium TaxID=4076 RepID=A0ABS8S5L3_DATST|nr:hypothetical protein [Datura stramonium]
MRYREGYHHSSSADMLAFASTCCSVHTSSTCHTLLRELEQIWKDIGETEADKDRMLLELERECLEVYQRKVEEAANTKACLHQSVAAKEAEVATLMAALGELNINSLIQPEKKSASLKEQLALVTPLIDDLRVKKDERVKQFADVKTQIDKITSEISGIQYECCEFLRSEDYDLSLRNLSEYKSRLRALQKEKSERIQKSDVHPSLHETSLGQSTNISASALESLEQAIFKLKTERKVRYQKLKDAAGLLFELWTLMDTRRKECSFIGGYSTGISRSGEATKLKASRMKELRAEQARIKVTKIPSYNILINKTLAWEDEKQKLFLYDGVRLVSILEDYKVVRQQKEESKKRARDQKKLQDMLLAEKESVYGSKPSPRRSSSFRKANGYHANDYGFRHLATSEPMSCATPELLTPRSNSVRQNGCFKEMRRLSTVPLNFVSMAKADTVSFSSISGSDPDSPPQA